MNPPVKSVTARFTSKSPTRVYPEGGSKRSTLLALLHPEYVHDECQRKPQEYKELSHKLGFEYAKACTKGLTFWILPWGSLNAKSFGRALKSFKIRLNNRRKPHPCFALTSTFGWRANCSFSVNLKQIRPPGLAVDIKGMQQVSVGSNSVEEPPASSSGTPLMTLAPPPAQPRPHVLFLIDHLLARGGGEGNLLKLVQLLPPDLVRCSVATFRINPEIRASITVPVHVFSMRRVYHLSSFKAACALRKLIRDERVDIVQTYFETSNLWGGLVAKLSGASLLSSRRDMGILRKAKHEFAYRLVNRISDRVLAVSEEVKRLCIDQERIDPAKVSVVYNGVDLEQLAAGSTSNPFAGAEWAKASHVITCVANIRKIKGVDVLVRCAERVCREIPGTVFVIAGSLWERDYSQEIQDLIRSHGLENNIKLLGFVEDPTPLLRMSNAFCMLSRSEGFSNALLEAMACGVPSVVTSVGGNPEAIRDGENGFLVSTEDDQAAAERLLFLLRNPGQAALMGEAARATVQTRFSAQTMISQLLEVYRELMAQRKPRS